MSRGRNVTPRLPIFSKDQPCEPPHDSRAVISATLKVQTLVDSATFLEWLENQSDLPAHTATPDKDVSPLVYGANRLSKTPVKSIHE
jgi:hypothetical protein